LHFARSFLLATQSTSQEIHFGEFSLDLRTGELRREGAAIKLQRQPAKVLTILAGCAGHVVTREELAKQVWGADTYVDFEHGLNYAIRQIRSVLADDPEHPRFVETLPKNGYRFIAAVNSPMALDPAEALSEPLKPPASQPAKNRHAFLYIPIAALAIAIVFVLTWWVWQSRSAGTIRIASIAVLPLRNLSNDPEQEYFSDGMTDELITDLAKSGGLRVISHTSVEQYKNTKTALPQIGRELGVDAIVEGTITRSADKVRITAQLIDARSDRHLWAESYERDLKDVFSLQDEVAQRIAAEIGISLKGDEPLARTSKRAVDSVAHESYLRGNFYWNQLSCDGFSKSRQYFEQAVAKDPGFARAYVGLAESYFTSADWGCSSEPDLIPKSKTAALKALELDPSLGEAHAWLGKTAFFYEWDFPKAENELKKAIELSPNYAEAHIIYAVFLVSTGRRAPGLAEITKAREIDPISQLPNVIAVVTFYLARQYDDAIEQGKRTVELYPGSAGAYDWLTSAYEKRGLYDEAIAAHLKARELNGASPKELTEIRITYQKAGMHGFWEMELADAQKNPRATTCWFTNIYAHLGNKTQAIEFLNQSSQQHCSSPLTTIADPIFDDFRGDPKFKEISSRLGL
jgi:TolB-like protein/DNA-binding winged helix-turn-helix (wHTH) protein/Tfp pilus assembly protein PilF